MDRDCQAVRFDHGLHLAAFFAPATAADLTVDRPCLALWTPDCLRLCDPTHKGGVLTFRWQGRPREVILLPGGRVVELTL